YSYFTAIAVDASNVYWTNAPHEGDPAKSSPGTLMAVPIAGGTPVTLAPAGEAPSCLVADGTSAYWMDGEGNLLKVTLNGGSPTTLVSEQSSCNGIAVDSTSVYWAGSGRGGCPEGGPCGAVMKLTPK